MRNTRAGTLEALCVHYIRGCRGIQVTAAYRRRFLLGIQPALRVIAPIDRKSVQKAATALPFPVPCTILGDERLNSSGCNSVVECLLPKQDVEGSNPFARSIHPLSPRPVPPISRLCPPCFRCRQIRPVVNYPQSNSRRIKEYCMAYVTPREGEGPESLVNRFRASVQHSGILRELKDRRFFRSKAQKERLAAQRAARRRRRQSRRNR